MGSLKYPNLDKIYINIIKQPTLSLRSGRKTVKYQMSSKPDVGYPLVTKGTNMGEENHGATESTEENLFM
jgi:hypothetical protein